jgi:hypothetical protein
MNDAFLAVHTAQEQRTLSASISNIHVSSRFHQCLSKFVAIGRSAKMQRCRILWVRSKLNPCVDGNAGLHQLAKNRYRVLALLSEGANKHCIQSMLVCNMYVASSIYELDHPV